MRFTRQALINRESYPDDVVVRDTLDFYYSRWHFNGVTIDVNEIVVDLRRLGYSGDLVNEAWAILSVVDPFSDKLPDGLKMIPFKSAGNLFYSSPVIESSQVLDTMLREAVESIGPTKWWRNATSKNDAYSFSVKAAGGARFSITLNDTRDVVDLSGMVPVRGVIHMFSEEGSQDRDIFPILAAIAKPTAEAIVASFDKELGWSEDN